METAPSHDSDLRRPLTIGIAGGPGVSTVIYMLRSILDGDDPYAHAGVVCSLETFDGVERRVGWRGTPAERDLARYTAHARTAGLDYLVVEVPCGEQSPCALDAAAFDLFCSLDSGSCVGRSGHVTTFSVGNTGADVWSDSERCSLGVVSFAAHTPSWQWRVAFPMPGAFNVRNALAAIAICMELGIDPARIVERFFYVRVPGRMELLLTPDRDIVGIIDQAVDAVSCREFFSAVAEEFPGYRFEAVLGNADVDDDDLPWGITLFAPSPTREDAILTAVECAYECYDYVLVCLLGSGGAPDRAQLDADIFNEAVRRFSPGPWTLSNEEQL